MYKIILSDEEVLHEKLVGEEGTPLLVPLLVTQCVLQLAGVEGVEGFVDPNVVRLHCHLVGQGLALVQGHLVLARHDLRHDRGSVHKSGNKNLLLSSL